MVYHTRKNISVTFPVSGLQEWGTVRLLSLKLRHEFDLVRSQLGLYYYYYYYYYYIIIIILLLYYYYYYYYYFIILLLILLARFKVPFWRQSFLFNTKIALTFRGTSQTITNAFNGIFKAKNRRSRVTCITLFKSHRARWFSRLLNLINIQ